MVWKTTEHLNTNMRVIKSFLMSKLTVADKNYIYFYHLTVYYKLVFIINYTKYKQEYYCHCTGKIFHFLKYSLQESQVLAPIIILIIFFCSLKIVFV